MTHFSFPSQSIWGKKKKKMQANFDKILKFMESVDKRLTNLESVTNNILRTQKEKPNGTTPVPPPSYFQTQVESVRHDLETIRETVKEAPRSYRAPVVESTDDEQLARELQASFDAEAREDDGKSRRKTTAIVERKQPPPPATTAKKETKSSSDSMEQCPVCGVKVPLNSIQEHVESCLFETEDVTPKEAPKPEQKSLFQRFFSNRRKEKHDLLFFSHLCFFFFFSLFLLAKKAEDQKPL